jgi:mono/diheme cytochrome c family protein
MLALTILIIITGHLGGSITHGSDYLTKAFSNSNENGTANNRKQIANIQEAKIYADVIEPLLASKCYGCHGPNKQKGKLRLDAPDFITKGGKDGKVILAGNAGESALSLRVALPTDNEDHMPPKEKPQLSKQEIELLHWWINSGASFDKPVKSLAQTANIKHILASLQTGGPAAEKPILVIPEKAVAKANDAALQQLKDRGVAIFPVAKNSNYLSANFVAVENLTAKDFALLEPIKQQLIWLKLGSTATSDEASDHISKLTSLTYLSLDRTQITDKGIAQLNTLSGLQYLNIVGTKVTVAGLAKLNGLKNIRQLFLYQTLVAGSDFAAVKKQFPTATIDTGGYTVPFLVSDTTEAKAPMPKK